MKTTFFAIVAAAALTACTVTPETESTPVNMVEIQNGQVVRVTERGPNTVVCQDYHRAVVMWDRAVGYPKWMAPADADAICRDKRQNALEAPTNKIWDGAYTGPHHADGTLIDGANDQVSDGPFDVVAK